MRFLGIDYGSQRIGLAVAGELRIAEPLLILERKRGDYFARLLEVIAREAIETIVVGVPYRLDGSTGPAAERALAFMGKLAEAVPIPVFGQDEALTSFAAEQELAARGQRKKPGTHVDALAARIILQEWLDAAETRADQG